MSTRSQAIIVFLLALAISVPVALSCGGTEPISDLNSPEVQDAAKFAVSEFNKQQGKIMNWWKPLLKYRKIVRGESRLVAGYYYRLVVLANDGKSEGLYEAVVYDVPWMKLKELKSFKKVQIG